MSQLPTFLIIGAAKSGTTSLYQYLGQHPDIFMSPEKEPHFFAFKDHPLNFSGPGDDKLIERTVSTWEGYRSLFESAESHMAIGEASPSTLYFPASVRRIEKYLPEARLVVILRNPVDRAHSNFYTMLLQAREPQSSFRAALEKEDERIASNWSMFWHYKRLGFYHSQLSRFYERFSSDQIHVCLFNDFVQNPTAVSQDIFSFIGVDNTFVPDTSTQYNQSGHPKSWALHYLLQCAGIGKKVRTVLPSSLNKLIGTYCQPVTRRMRQWKKYIVHRNLESPSLAAETRSYLRDLYREDIRRLQSLISRDLSHWLE